jgi:hypothetical protein
LGEEPANIQNNATTSSWIHLVSDSYLVLLESAEHERTGYHSGTTAAIYVSQRAVAQIPLEDRKVLCMPDPVAER